MFEHPCLKLLSEQWHVAVQPTSDTIHRTSLTIRTALVVFYKSRCWLSVVTGSFVCAVIPSVLVTENYFWE